MDRFRHRPRDNERLTTIELTPAEREALGRAALNWVLEYFRTTSERSGLPSGLDARARRPRGREPPGGAATRGPGARAVRGARGARTQERASAHVRLRAVVRQLRRGHRRLPGLGAQPERDVVAISAVGHCRGASGGRLDEGAGRLRCQRGRHPVERRIAGELRRTGGGASRQHDGGHQLARRSGLTWPAAYLHLDDDAHVHAEGRRHDGDWPRCHRAHSGGRGIPHAPRGAGQRRRGRPRSGTAPGLRGGQCR